ncbi:MAG: TetR/AcrR family transcriptional regulator [Tepidisphaeraceae bacterium]|jgi:TetR/AcrR family transcriptional regulator
MSRLAPQRPAAVHSRNKETRAAILAAASRIFAKGGLAGARTDAIAAAAGVNKALLYYYFKSKEGLYEAVVEKHFGDFNRRAIEVLSAPGPAQAVMLKYVSMHMDFISANHQSAPLFQQMMMTGGKFLERMIPKYFSARGEALTRLIQRGVRSGEFRRVDPFHATMSIVSLIVFYFTAARVLQLMGHPNAYTEANLKRRKREVLDFLRHGLFTELDGSAS